MNIFIGTSSRDELDKKILNMSDELIEKLAQIPDLNLVYGGYDHGVMKKCHDEFKKNKKEIIGITVDAFDDELDCSEVIIKKSTFDRTKEIYNKSDILLILPGGIGTLAELFSIIEQMRTYDNDKILILYNKDFYYKDLIEEIYRMYQEKLIEYPPSEYMLISNDIDEIMTVVENF